MIEVSIQEKLQYPEILWQRPYHTKQKKGKVLVIGGEKEIAKTLFFCEILYLSGLSQVKLVYPQKNSNLFQKILPKEMAFPVPSSPQGTFSGKTFEKIKQISSEYDIIVLGVGLSKSQETKRIIEKLIDIDKPVLFYQEGILPSALKKYQKRKGLSILYLEANIYYWINERPQLVNRSLAVNVKKMVDNFSNSPVILYQDRANAEVWVVSREKITKTALINYQNEVLVGLMTSFWAQNIHKPFQTACCAAYVVKIWQEKYHKIEDINKAIEDILINSEKEN